MFMGCLLIAAPSFSLRSEREQMCMTDEQSRATPWKTSLISQTQTKKDAVERVQAD